VLLVADTKTGPDSTSMLHLGYSESPAVYITYAYFHSHTLTDVN